MTERPILNHFNRFLLAILALVTFAGFFLVPLDQDLPIHWDLNGVADRFAPAPLALLFPALMALLVTGLTIALHRSKLRNDFNAGRHVIDTTVSFILLLAVLLAGVTIAFGMGSEIAMPRLITFALGAMLMGIGNYLPKTQPNRVAGIRLPWTLGDPANWTRTHIWTGRLMMLGGAIALLAAILDAPPAMLFAVVLAAALLPALAGVLISYLLARR